MPRPALDAPLALDNTLLRLLDAEASPVPATQPRPGLNFALQDYLALATHPAVRAAALAALGTHRLVAPRDGLSAPVLALEDRLAAFLGLPAAVTFPSGTEAIRQTLGSLFRPGDHVIVDCAAHPAMFETVLLAKAHLHRSPAASVEGVERRLARLSRQPRRGRLAIAVSAVSAQTWPSFPPLPASTVRSLSSMSAMTLARWARRAGA